MLKTKVILNQVTNLSDARYASGMGVDYIGFVINPESEQFVTPEQVKSITTWLSGVHIIGDLEDSETPDHESYPIDLVQTENLQILNRLDKAIITFKLAPENIADTEAQLAITKNKASFFIIQLAQDQLLGLKDALTRFCDAFKVFIATDFNTQNLELLLDKIKPEGIVIYGSNEEKPGLSSYDGIADILEQLEVD